MNILMTLMGLETGGAETHVVELVAALIRRGHTVTVASNGGTYEQELKRLGVQHYQLPLHSKKLPNMVKSYRGLKRILQTHSFDLVHAHARIPGFLCGLLQKRLRFRFITSTHWVFKTGPLLTLMTNWGERTVAVSDDIKQYLIKHYDMPQDRISVTINGIDTEKFNPSTTPDGVDAEFGLLPNKRRIVSVSRMDADRSAVAFQLCSIMPRLRARYGDVELVLVGGGNDFARLEQHANQINQQIGERAIVLTGARTDVSRFVATADVFVGVSRAVLEAMAAAKPVVIAGNEGYIGIYEPSKQEIALKTNFCCRGCEMSTEELLLRDLSSLLSAAPEQLEAVGQYNRQTIVERYSVEKMTDDYEAAYAALLAQNPLRPHDVLISGYYGYKNLGDDSLLEAIISGIKQNKPDVSITVLSRRPKETSATFGVNSVHRFRAVTIYRLMRRTKLLISGGGSLIQDVTSTQSLYYYLSIIHLARRSGMRVMVYANGIGPVNNPKNRNRCTQVLNEADYISLRDDDSREELERLHVSRPHITVSADPAFTLTRSAPERVQDIFEQENITFASGYFIVSLREWKHAGPGFEQQVASLCDYVASKYGLTPLFVAMQGSLDRPACRRVRGMLTCKSQLLKQSYSATDLLGIVANCQFVLGMRLHVLIYALSMGVPVVGLSYDPKIDAMLRQFQQPTGADVACLEQDRLRQIVDDLLENHEQKKQQISDIAAETKEKAALDAQMAIRLLSF